ncbi:MFS transporter [Microterricola gilva]|uniref:MFS transporter n=1 Tax=Microterricola gilva TaxID=393267 RepID=UPI001F5EF376|nr:MFS transporter [Microterricola gilva]
MLALGLALTAVATAGVMLSGSVQMLGVMFVFCGMAAASTNAASGRVVVGWFDRDRRGFAMGVRQIAQPLGVTVAALTVPTLAAGGGIATAVLPPLLLLTVLAVACWFGIVNPPRASVVSAAAAPLPVSPYRASGFLWRIHAVALLLVVPQFTLTTFGLVWLVSDLEWTPLAAGVAIAVAQFVGAMGRIALGAVSDRARSRVWLLRVVAVAAAVAMVLLGSVAAWLPDAALVVAMMLVIASTITVADNGLTFTSVAEGAGSSWAGRAFGIHNTGQYIAATAVGPVVGGLIGLIGFPLAFAAVAVAPVFAIPLVPRRDHDAIGAVPATAVAVAR